MHLKHYKALNLKKLVLFVYHFKLLLKTVFYLSCKIWFLHIWDFDFHVYRNLMNRSRYVIYKLWGLLHDLILNCLTMIFLPPNVARINGEAGGGTDYIFTATPDLRSKIYSLIFFEFQTVYRFKICWNFATRFRFSKLLFFEKYLNYRGEI